MRQFLEVERELTEIEILKGKILNPAQKLYLRTLFTEMTLTLAEADLSQTAEERTSMELRRSYDCGKRAFIAELLADSENAEIELKQFDQPQNATSSAN